MVFKTSAGHKFINKEPLIILNAVTNKFNEIRMVKLSKKVDLSLHEAVSQTQLHSQF